MNSDIICNVPSLETCTNSLTRFKILVDHYNDIINSLYYTKHYKFLPSSRINSFSDLLSFIDAFSKILVPELYRSPSEFSQLQQVSIDILKSNQVINNIIIHDSLISSFKNPNEFSIKTAQESISKYINGIKFPHIHSVYIYLSRSNSSLRIQTLPPNESDIIGSVYTYFYKSEFVYKLNPEQSTSYDNTIVCLKPIKFDEINSAIKTEFGSQINGHINSLTEKSISNLITNVLQSISSVTNSTFENFDIHRDYNDFISIDTDLYKQSICCAVNALNTIEFSLLSIFGYLSTNSVTFPPYELSDDPSRILFDALFSSFVNRSTEYSHIMSDNISQHDTRKIKHFIQLYSENHSSEPISQTLQSFNMIDNQSYVNLILDHLVEFTTTLNPSDHYIISNFKYEFLSQIASNYSNQIELIISSENLDEEESLTTLPIIKRFSCFVKDYVSSSSNTLDILNNFEKYYSGKLNSSAYERKLVSSFIHYIRNEISRNPYISPIKTYRLLCQTLSIDYFSILDDYKTFANEYSQASLNVISEYRNYISVHANPTSLRCLFEAFIENNPKYLLENGRQQSRAIELIRKYIRNNSTDIKLDHILDSFKEFCNKLNRIDVYNSFNAYIQLVNPIIYNIVNIFHDFIQEHLQPNDFEQIWNLYNSFASSYGNKMMKLQSLKHFHDKYVKLPNTTCVEGSEAVDYNNAKEIYSKIDKGNNSINNNISSEKVKYSEYDHPFKDVVKERQDYNSEVYHYVTLDEIAKYGIENVIDPDKTNYLVSEYLDSNPTYQDIKNMFPDMEISLKETSTEPQRGTYDITSDMADNFDNLIAAHNKIITDIEIFLKANNIRLLMLPSMFKFTNNEENSLSIISNENSQKPSRHYGLLNNGTLMSLNSISPSYRFDKPLQNMKVQGGKHEEMNFVWYMQIIQWALVGILISLLIMLIIRNCHTKPKWPEKIEKKDNKLEHEHNFK